MGIPPALATVSRSRYINHPRTNDLVGRSIGDEVGRYLSDWIKYDPGCDDGFVVRIRRIEWPLDFAAWTIERVDNENQ